MDEDKYKKMLERAYKSIPKKIETSERFEVPQAEIIQQGNRTIIKNFGSIADKLRREPKHLAKYLSKELAAPGNIDNMRFILNSKISERSINEKIKSYVETFVICKQCKRPDTKLVESERGIFTIICEACGARGPAPKI